MMKDLFLNRYSLILGSSAAAIALMVSLSNKKGGASLVGNMAYSAGFGMLMGSVVKTVIEEHAKPDSTTS